MTLPEGGGWDRVEARIGQIEARFAALAEGDPTSTGQEFAQALAQASRTTGAAPGVVPGSNAGVNNDAANGFAALPPPPGWVAPMPVPLPPTTAAVGTPPKVGVARWEGLIQKYAARYDVSPHLVRAVLAQESEGNPRAVSPAGAMGLMQLMPANVREAGVTDPFDPDQNVRAGVAQLREHLDRYRGDVSLALAAYNAGPGNVAKYDGIPPFRETQNYVRKILTRLGPQPGAGEAAGG